MILKYLSFRKLRLLILLWSSHKLSYLLKKDFRWGRYIALAIEPTNSCNLSCIECPTGTSNLTRKLGQFSLSAFRKILKEKGKDLIYLNFYFQGEPFLNKQTTEMIKLASTQNIYTSTSTNAQLIDKKLAQEIVLSGLNRIIISIDGSSQDVYEKYRRGGQLSLVVDATQNLVKAKAENNSQLKIVFQFLVFKHNEHQIDDIQQLGKKLGVDEVEIKTAQIYNFEESNNVPTISKYARYKKYLSGKYEIKSQLKNKCWRMWHSGVISQDLNIVPCCFDKDSEYIFGNLNQQSISEIEAASKYKKFRQKISDGRLSIPMCNNCSEGLKL